MKCRLLIGAAGLMSLLVSVSAQDDQPVVEWDFESEVAFSGGYKENILQSSIADESSGFFRTSADLSAMRFAETGSYLLFYLFGEDTRYFDAPSVNYEQFISLVANGASPMGDDDMIGLDTTYLYIRQIYDASETQAIQRRLLVLGHSLTLQPYWEHEYGDKWGHSFDFRVFRQIYEVELDDYLEMEGLLQLIRTYGHRSEWSIGYGYMQRHYDTREQFDEDGLIVPGTDLMYVQNKLFGEWRHYFDEDRNWRSLTKFSGMMNRDNGSGYFDYDRMLLRQQLRWDNDVWELSGNARFGWYFYKLQTVGEDKRERTYASIDLRVARKFGDHVALFAEGEHEWNQSNDTLDEYETWMAHAGIVLTM